MRWKLLVVLAITLCSCKQTQYIPVASHSTDSVMVYKHSRDSIFVKDSVFVRQKNDTILINRYKYLFVDKLRTDTMFVTKVDTIRVPYAVEKKLGKWEQVKIELGGLAFGGIAVIFLMIIVRWLLINVNKI